MLYYTIDVQIYLVFLAKDLTFDIRHSTFDLTLLFIFVSLMALVQQTAVGGSESSVDSVVMEAATTKALALALVTATNYSGYNNFGGISSTSSP